MAPSDFAERLNALLESGTDHAIQLLGTPDTLPSMLTKLTTPRATPRG
ncbi:MAG TPA: hypothetical protein VGH69_08740 [Mycobacterium sp.]|jgi:hypothetical protein